MSDGTCQALGVLRGGAPETQFFAIEPNHWYDARTHQPPHKAIVSVWMTTGFGDEARHYFRFKNGWYEAPHGDLFQSVDDPESLKEDPEADEAPAAVSHWMIIGRPE